MTHREPKPENVWPECTDPNWAQYTDIPCACPAHFNGHFPGCDTHGCEVTRCADARFMIAFAKSRTP